MKKSDIDYLDTVKLNSKKLVYSLGEINALLHHTLGLLRNKKLSKYQKSRINQLLHSCTPQQFLHYYLLM